MKTEPLLRKACAGLIALLISIALGLSMEVARKLRPDAVDLGGYIYQLVGRTLRSFSSNAITGAFSLVGLYLLANRYLFQKPRGTKAGEYLLSLFFSLTMLTCASIRATGSIQTLWENYFQVLKALVYLAGTFPLFLFAIRGLNELLQRQRTGNPVSLWNKHPFAFPALVLAIAWVGQVIIKYPGVLAIDTVLPVKQFFGEWPRTTVHPVFTTLFYGLMVTAGKAVGNVNLIYFAVMLSQVIALLLVLSYISWLMNVHKAPFWVQLASLALFAVSPVYIGWAVVIIKDTPYLITTVFTGALMLECLIDPCRFIGKKSRWALLAACLLTMLLFRYNGVYIAVPALLVILFAILKKPASRKVIAAFILFGGMLLGASFGINELIIAKLGMQRVEFYDWLSIPFQQTARVAKLHGNTLSEQEIADVDTMILYDKLPEKYTPNEADQVKWTVEQEVRGLRSPERYLRVWWKQLQQYPLDYVDAMLNLNSIMFDMQANAPVYIGLSDTTQSDYVYPSSFADMSYYDHEAIRALNGYQLALTEWYFQFSNFPLIGAFASMGFCVNLMIAMLYLSWVNRRKGALLVMLPSVITAVATLFCSVVYTRYLLPAMGSLPLWFAAYSLLKQNQETGEKSSLASQ